MLKGVFEFNKKQVIIGVGGIVLSAAGAAAFGVLDPGGAMSELTASGIALRLLMCTCLALAIGFLLFIFGGIKLFFVGFAQIEVYTILLSVINIDIAVGAIVVIIVIAAIAWIFTVVSYRNIKREINISDAEVRVIDEAIAAAGTALSDEDDNKLKSEIKYFDKSVLLSNAMNGVYQVIKIAEGFYFKYIGNNAFKGLDESKLVRDFDGLAVDTSDKKNFVIRYSDIEGMSAKVKPNPDVQAIAMHDFGTVKIKLVGGGKKTFYFIHAVEEEEIKGFFGAIEVKVKRKAAVEEKRESMDQAHRAALNKCNTALFVYSIVSVPIFEFYLFIGAVKIVAQYITPICLALALMPIVLYLALPKYFSLRGDGRNRGQNIVNGKINISFLILIPIMVLMLHALFVGQHMFHYDLLALFLISLAVAAVIALIILLFSKEYRKHKSCILAIVMFAVIFSPSAVYAVNRAYDFKRAENVKCEITEKYTFTDKKGEVSYYFVIDYNGDGKKAEVEQKTYEYFEEGEAVIVKKYHGALGIEYAYYEDEI